MRSCSALGDMRPWGSGSKHLSRQLMDRRGAIAGPRRLGAAMAAHGRETTARCRPSPYMLSGSRRQWVAGGGGNLHATERAPLPAAPIRKGREVPMLKLRNIMTTDVVSVTPLTTLRD